MWASPSRNAPEVEATDSQRKPVRFVLQYVLPPLGVVVAAAVYQKGIAPLLWDDMSRLHPGGLGGMVRSSAYWLSLVGQVPLLLADGLRRPGLTVHPMTALALIAVVVCLFLPSVTLAGRAERRKASKKKPPSDAKFTDKQTDVSAWSPRRLAALCIACLIASAGLFVLSGSYAVVYGYDNRKLTSFWIVLALTASLLVSPKAHLPAPRSAALDKRRADRFAIGLRCVILAALVVMATQSFLVQRDNYLAGWELQRRILGAFHQTTAEGDLPQQATILAAVPPAVHTNYNDECVFTRPWDFGNAVRLQTQGRVASAAPIYPWLRTQGRIRLENDRVEIDGLWSAELDRSLWYFEFDPDTSSARLEPIRSPEQLRHVLDQATKGDLNAPPIGWARRFVETTAAWVRVEWLGRNDLESSW
ncbi:MAG: hypothetical protein D6741_14885 [Planctomycetota bacterium]|nr:MAG: hypothetical protein D6741_14885 [Planctomycetota bacterium]